MSDLTYKRILEPYDKDIPRLLAAYRMPEVSHFLSIGDNYFDYVTSGESIFFYKVYENGALVGTLHLEKSGNVLYMSILVFPELQGRGIGTRVVDDVCKDTLGLGFERIEISVDRNNIASLRLFKNAGFVPLCEEDGLINLVYPKENGKTV